MMKKTENPKKDENQKTSKQRKSEEGPEYPGEGAARKLAAGSYSFKC